MNNKLLDSNLAFIAKVNKDLYTLLEDASASVTWDENDSLFFDKLLVLPAFNSSLIAKLESQFKKPNRVRVARIENQLPSLPLNKLVHQLIDFHGGKILANLPNLNIGSVGSQAPHAEPLRDYLLLGSLSLVPFIKSIENQQGWTPTSITIVESDVRQLVATLSRVDFSAFVNSCRERSIGLNLIFETDPVKLQESLFFYLTLNMPLALHGLQVIDSAISHPTLEEVRGWLFSQSGIGYRFLGTLGSTTDEINQVMQAAWNSFNPKPVRWLKPIPADSMHKCATAVIVGSGPSLEGELPRLLEHRDKLIIFAAGSGLGSLMRAGILPDAVVFVERGSSVFEDLRELLDEGFNFNGIRLFASVTTDPRIRDLFSDVYLFQRPASTAIALFPEGSASALLHAGPESNNAAVDVALYLGFDRLLLLGCDFGAADRKHPRARNAIGSTPRVLDEPVRSNKGRTIFSNPSLLVSRDVLNASLSHYPHIDSRRIGEGAELSLATDTTWADLDADGWLKGASIWSIIESYCQPIHEPGLFLKEIAAEAKAILPVHTEALLQAIRSNASSSWTIELHRLFAPLFEQYPSESKAQAELLIHRLYREILFHALAPLQRLGGTPGQWIQVVEELEASLEYCNSLFFAVLSWIELLTVEKVSANNWNPQDVGNQLSDLIDQTY